jgi:hypothetical protein
MHPCIVRGIEQIAVILLNQHDMLFGLDIDPPQLILFIGTGNQRAVIVKIQAVAPARRLHKRHQLLLGRIDHNPVIRLIGKIHIARRIRRRPFGKRKFRRNLHQRCPVRNNPACLDAILTITRRGTTDTSCKNPDKKQTENRQFDI